MASPPAARSARLCSRRTSPRPRSRSTTSSTWCAAGRWPRATLGPIRRSQSHYRRAVSIRWRRAVSACSVPLSAPEHVFLPACELANAPARATGGRRQGQGEDLRRPQPALLPPPRLGFPGGPSRRVHCTVFSRRPLCFTLSHGESRRGNSGAPEGDLTPSVGGDAPGRGAAAAGARRPRAGGRLLPPLHEAAARWALDRNAIHPPAGHSTV